MAMYENVSQLSAGVKYGAQRTVVTEPYVAKSALGFGKAAFGYEGDPDTAIDIETDENTITYDADFVTANVVDVTVNGNAIDSVTFVDDQATTMALVVAAIQALDPDYKVEVAARVITIVTPGETCVPTSVVTLGATQAGVTIGTAAASGEHVFLGPVIKAQKAPTDVSGSATGYVVDEMLEVMRSGYLTVVVDAIANCTVHKPVYVIVAGADKGKFTGTVGSNLLINATFHILGDGTQDLAVVNFEQLPLAVA
jgi:hypothetical protein